MVWIAILMSLHFIHKVVLVRRQQMTFRFSSQAATCPSVYHMRWRLHTVPLIAECQEEKL